MIFFYSSGNQIDTSFGINMSNFRKKHLISALHFNDPVNINRDECGNEWKVNGNISIIEDSDIAPYRNVCCLGNASSLILENPVEITTNAYTVDFWTKTKVIENLSSTSDMKDTVAGVDKNFLIGLYTKGSTGELIPVIEFYNGAFAVRYDTGSLTGYAYYKNKNKETAAYTLISRDLNGLHHFAISYTTKPMLSIWIDGYPINASDSISLIDLYNNSLYIKICNLYTNSEEYTPMYISNFRIWDATLNKANSDFNYTRAAPTLELKTEEYENGIHSRRFLKEIEELKELKSKQMTKHNFLRNKTNSVYRDYIDDSGYIPKSPKLKEITDNDLIYLPFDDKTDVLKDLGSYGMTWENVTSKGRLSLSTYPTNYKIYDYKIKLNNSMHVTANTVTGSSTLVPDKKFYTYYSSSQFYPICYVQKLFTGYIKSDKIFTFSNYPEFTIEFFAHTENLLEDGKKRKYSKNYATNEWSYSEEEIETIYNTITFSDISTKNIKSLSHIALVYNSENVKKYVNGILTDTLSYTFEDGILKLQNTYYFDDVKNYYDTGPRGSAFQTSVMNKQYRVLSAYMGQFRIRNIAAYNEDFDPLQELFIYDQDIMTYLNSQKQLLSISNILLKYPIKNPQTIYDIAYSNNTQIQFKPEYDTTKYVDYDTYYILQENNFPTEYNGYYPVFSAVNNVEGNDIKFRINKLAEINYSVSCWIYIKINKESEVYQDLLYISGINNFVGVQASPNGNIKIVHHNSQRYSTETRTSADNSDCEENIYPIENIQNHWVYFEFQHVNSKMTVKVNSNVIKEIEEYSNKYLHRIILTIGARRTNSITPYYLGLTVTKI